MIELIAMSNHSQFFPSIFSLLLKRNFHSLSGIERIENAYFGVNESQLKTFDCMGLVMSHIDISHNIICTAIVGRCLARIS
jgi:hypothetical protein